MMRLVAQLGYRVKHPALGRIADPAAAIEYIRDGLPGYPGRPGDGLRPVLDLDTDVRPLTRRDLHH